jgi:DNA gyrase/topoisomerase IV subunit B
MAPVFCEGHLFIAQPPLYKIQQGKKSHYVYNDEEKEKVLAEFRGKIEGLEEDKKNKQKKEGDEVEAYSVKIDGYIRYFDFDLLNGEELAFTIEIYPITDVEYNTRMKYFK